MAAVPPTLGAVHPVLRVALTVEQCWQPVPGGSGSYITELGRALRERDDVEVVGLSARHGSDESPGVEVPVPVRSSRLPRVPLYESWNRLRRPRAEQIAGDLDVVHATTWAVPGTRAPLVVTVHDLAFLREPDHFTRRGNAYFRRALDVVRGEAAAVVVPSQASRDDCVAHGIDASRVHVVPHGVRAESVHPDDVAAWRLRHGVTRPYVLWCGTLEPRKNVGRLLEAYARAGLDEDLVLVGPSGWGGVAQSVALAATDGVHWLGRLSEHDLQIAYAGARAFAFPSLWEGFGMPVLEAMAHGVPALTSAGSPMAEFLGGGGVTVEPTDVDALASGLARVVGEEHDDLARAALDVATGLTWAASAQSHVQVYRSVVGR